MRPGRQTSATRADVLDPRARGVDERSRTRRSALAGIDVAKLQRPDLGRPLGAFNLGTAANFSAAIGCVSSVQDNQTRVINATVGIFESKPEHVRPERKPCEISRQIEGSCAGQSFPAADMIIQEEA